MCEEGIYLSIDEAARMLETTNLRILMMLKNHELDGVLEGDAWKVSKVSLQLCGKPHPSGVAGKKGCGGGCGGGCRPES